MWVKWALLGSILLALFVVAFAPEDFKNRFTPLVLSILGPAITIMIAIWVIQSGVARGIQRSGRAINPIGLTTKQATGPGRYRISGVDRESKMETTWQCEAQSEANARAKAELEGIVVTLIERVN